MKMKMIIMGESEVGDRVIGSGSLDRDELSRSKSETLAPEQGSDSLRRHC